MMNTQTDSKTGEGNAPRVTKIQTEHRLESGRLVYVPPGMKVIPANNLPEDSTIKYWLAEFPYGWSSDNEIESYFRNIGFGFTENEVA